MPRSRNRGGLNPNREFIPKKYRGVLKSCVLVHRKRPSGPGRGTPQCVFRGRVKSPFFYSSEIERIVFNPKTRAIKILCQNNNWYIYYPFKDSADYSPPSEVATVTAPASVERTLPTAPAPILSIPTSQEGIVTYMYNQPLAILRAAYPEIFNKKTPVPLKIGIHKNIEEELQLSPQLVSQALIPWTRHRKYLYALSQGGIRYDLRGRPAGYVSRGDAEGARKRLVHVWSNRQPELGDLVGMLEATPPGARMADLEDMVFKRALSVHPRAAEKIGIGVWQIRRHPTHFVPVVVRYDGSTDTFSMRKCVIRSF